LHEKKLCWWQTAQGRPADHYRVPRTMSGDNRYPVTAGRNDPRPCQSLGRLVNRVVDIVRLLCQGW
jgi:hypothetical protein